MSSQKQTAVQNEMKSNAKYGFLRRVARAYIDNEGGNLDGFCFVFPNKRSATFFMHYLQQELGERQALLPRVITIADLMASTSDLVEASAIDRLMVLFKAYCSLMGDGAPQLDFERFVFWGEMLLDDFDDVDRYLVDARQLFVNIKRLNEIQADYLTDEQREVIARYWRDKHSLEPADDKSENRREEVRRFWLHTAGKGENFDDDTDLQFDRESTKPFVKLWEVLWPLYQAYHEALEKDGFTTSGRIYRQAAERLDQCALLDRYERFIFVGFNVLTGSELRVLNRLKDLGRADFYWDMPSSAFRGSEVHLDNGTTSFVNKAMRYVWRNSRVFKSRYDIGDEEVYDKIERPVLRVVSVPSRVGQVKQASEQITQWLDTGYIDAKEAINTAVVLPDESLFVPAINSIPHEIAGVNVTMGYPLRRTPVATFMKAVTSLHMRARRSGNSVSFFNEDVLDVLTHSVASTINDAQVKALVTRVKKDRKYMVDIKVISAEAPSLQPIFDVVDDDKDPAKVSAYINGVLDMLERALLPDNENDVDDEHMQDRRIQRLFLRAYRQEFDLLIEAAETHNIRPAESTYFQLVERSLASKTVTLRGEPLRGLQVMGVLETRALDFDNIIIMSMNEGTMPQRSEIRSFIPDTLRHAYHMTTTEHQESLHAYNFYRLISRARNVTLLYDGRSVGVKHSEVSRFIVQLLYLYSDAFTSVKHQLATHRAISNDPPSISVPKDDRVMGLLRKYLTPGSGKNLSASSLNEYILCPLAFYLRYVEGFNLDDEIENYINASEQGSIVHRVFEQLYATANGGNYPATITLSNLEQWSSPADTTVNKLVHAAIDEVHLKLDREKWGSSHLLGETENMHKLFCAQIKKMLEHEKALAPFEVIDAERKIVKNMDIGGYNVNVKQYIDRIDRVNIDRSDGGTLRVVDYKTGKDETSCRSIEYAMTPEGHAGKAFAQLYFYCHVLSDDENALCRNGIQPVIYKLQSIFSSKFNMDLRFGKTVVKDFRGPDGTTLWYDEYLTQLDRVVSEIFNPDVPFTQSRCIGDACVFCKFKPICGVEEADDSKW